MCLQPISIRNPTKRLVTSGGQLLKMQVQCNHCAECVQQKRNEWYVRTKFEVERTLSVGGYVYYDTLTYDDEHLPKLSHYCDINKYGLRDFSCFDKSHFRLFLKRLRRKMSYHLKVNKNAFRYFITSEYGTDERYTHRPHYHILFFVDCGVSPVTFSRYVSECWTYGRTDGIPYQTSNYVMTHVYSNSNNTSFKAVENVCMYVSKYITKNSQFAQKLAQRKSYLRNAIVSYNTLNQAYISDDDEQYICDLCRNIDMFHRQSQGFGASYLNNMTPEKLMFIDNNKVLLKDSNKVVSTYQLPMYYKRKLFYTIKKHADGKRYWELTERGKKHIINSKLASVDRFSLTYMDLVNNCPDDVLKNKLYQYLDGRSMQDYVIYELFYRGRHRHKDSINYKTNNQKNELSDEEINLFDWLLFCSRSITPYSVDSNSATSVDEDTCRPRVITESEIQKLEDEFCRNGHPFAPFSSSRGYKFADYVNRYTFNENSCYEFRNFDHVNTILNLMRKLESETKQSTFDFIEDLKNRYKILFNKTL